MPASTNVTFFGIMNSFKKRYTKTNRTMMTGIVEDLSNKAPFVIFPDKYEALNNLLLEDRILKISGTSDHRNDQFQIIVDALEEITTPPQKIEKIIISPEKDKLDNIKEMLLSHNKGSIPVYLDIDNYKILLHKKYWTNTRHIDEIQKFSGVENITTDV